MLCINSIVSFKGNKNVVIGIETDINGDVEKYIVEDRFTGNREKVTEDVLVPWSKAKYQVKKTFNSK